jgi:hypothetical protein
MLARETSSPVRATCTVEVGAPSEDFCRRTVDDTAKAHEDAVTANGALATRLRSRTPRSAVAFPPPSDAERSLDCQAHGVRTLATPMFARGGGGRGTDERIAALVEQLRVLERRAIDAEASFEASNARTRSEVLGECEARLRRERSSWERALADAEDRAAQFERSELLASRELCDAQREAADLRYAATELEARLEQSESERSRLSDLLARSESARSELLARIESERSAAEERLAAADAEHEALRSELRASREANAQLDRYFVELGKRLDQRDARQAEQERHQQQQQLQQQHQPVHATARPSMRPITTAASSSSAAPARIRFANLPQQLPIVQRTPETLDEVKIEIILARERELRRDCDELRARNAELEAERFLDSGVVTVAARLRPMSSGLGPSTKPCITCNESGTSVVLLDSGKSYALDRAFAPSATQLDVFEELLRAQIERVVESKTNLRVCVIAKGSSGSGKTHTLFGSGALASDPLAPGAGLVPRSIACAFSRGARRISASAYECSGRSGEILDLFALPAQQQQQQRQQQQSQPQQQRRQPCIDYGRDGKPTLVGVERVWASSAAEAWTAIREALSRRRTASTFRNQTSSRTHAFVVVRVHASDAEPDRVTATFQFVDLAGNEDLASVGTTEALREGSAINLAHSDIAAMLAASAKRRAFDSTLLRSPSRVPALLYTSLSGACKTTLIYALSQDPDEARHVAQSLVEARSAMACTTKR